MRPIDLARPYGLSSQAIRNYEDAGVLPPAVRTTSGHRRYDKVHAYALRTFLALVAAHGYATAGAVLRAVLAGDRSAVWALLDAGHIELAADRETLELVGRAVGDLTASASDVEVVAHTGRRAPGPADLTVGELGRRLDLSPATLRTWERTGILSPVRDPRTGYRRFSADDVRDAMLAGQLRRGGYLLAQIADVVTRIRQHRDPEALRATLGDWQLRLDTRARAMLTAAAALAELLDLLDRLDPRDRLDRLDRPTDD